MDRLQTLDQVPEVLRPRYNPTAHGVGIVHLGLGAFHKAHQAAMTDTAIAADGGNWRILGVSLRNLRAAEELAPQNGLYTLIEKGGEGAQARVIGAIAGAICSAEDPEPALQAMAAAATQIVTLTVTEKAYGLDRARKGCDPSHPSVAADLATPDRPQGVLGMLSAALARRRAEGTAPFTVLCCDNLSENGHLLRGAVIDFARRHDADLAEWIAEHVAFPSSMVDRITPAATDATRQEAAAWIGAEDHAAIETEHFVQWVIEDNFPTGRPSWEKAGAIFAPDVAPFEAMKLRMLNGSHSMLAYAGFHAGHRYVRDVMQDTALARLVQRHLEGAAATLPPITGIDLQGYAKALLQRFANPSIAHETFQIAMDGSEKLPQRIFAAVLDARLAQSEVRPFAFATAAWLRHVSGATHDCPAYTLRDPRAAELQAMVEEKSAAQIVDVISQHGIVPMGLRKDSPFWRATTELLEEMLREPMREVIAREAR
jgi:fructuronate reductase